MTRAFLAATALVLALPSTSLARTLDFQRYVHGEVRRDSYTFFCIEEKGSREIVELINSYANGKIFGKVVGAAIKGKTIEYKCNRQDLIHMSLKTLIKGKISDIETVDNRPVWITKDASLVKAQARDGLIVYVITNAPVPPPEAGKTSPRVDDSLPSKQSGQDVKKIETTRTCISRSVHNPPPKKSLDESKKTAAISLNAPGNTAASALPKTKPAQMTDSELKKTTQEILEEEEKKENSPPRPPDILGTNITDEKLVEAIQNIPGNEDREAREAPPLPEVEEKSSDEGEKSVASSRKLPGAPLASVDLKQGQAVKSAKSVALQPEEKARLAPEEMNDRPCVIKRKPDDDEKP
jgi:hypothetical protein